jgi:hypothetical protein
MENTMDGNIVSSRSPFQKLRHSPWKRRGMNEKSPADNALGVKPSKTMEVKGTRPRSPFRTLRPISNATNGTGVSSPWKRHTKKRTKKIDNREGLKTTLHESEINIFQQLCLEKHDENYAIEILLDSVENNIPELYASSSESTGRGSRALSKEKAGSIEGKRKLLDRFFFKSPWKPTSSSGFPTDFVDSSKKNNFAWSHSSNFIDGLNIPSPPSSVPRTRITIEDTTPKPTTSVEDTFQATTNSRWATPMKYSVETKEKKTREILDDLSEGLDNFSNISTLSGTRATSIITPVTFDRQESLGLESIKDIRKCLKEMEHQLSQASNNGQKVSRQKVMRALFTVADSLEDDEEKSYLKKELNTAMETERDEATQPVETNHLNDDKSELTTSDDEDFTLDSCAFDEDGDKNIDIDESPFNIVSSVGNFFGVNEKNQQAVEEVLDDLLWTEFVWSRQKKSSNTTSLVSKQSRSTHSLKGHKILLQIKDCDTSRKKKKLDSGDQISRTRSWWRNHPSKDEDEDYDDDDDDDDESSSSSEQELSSYLPSSITIKQQYKKKPTKSNSVSNPNYKVKLVHTESRQGYEMDNNSRRSRIM